MDEILAAAFGDAVRGHLDHLDDLVVNADARSLQALATTEVARLTDTVRAMLAEHTADDEGRCRQCRGLFRRRAHPCSVWTVAHRHLIGEGTHHGGTRGCTRFAHRARHAVAGHSLGHRRAGDA